MAEKIKMSAIREQFPMYADVSDAQLLSAVRRKHYADIPMAQFVGRIDFDTEQARRQQELIGEMSGPERFLAGAGKALTDIGRGTGQYLGLVSREDVEESRRLDAPLMGTGAGVAGNITGNVAALLPTAFIPGANTLTGAAAIGAATGALAPSTSTAETLKNVGVGGALGPASILAGRGVGAAYQGVKGLADPLTRRGQERVAASTLRAFAQDPARAATNIGRARELVKGSAPTLAQAADDPGLAQLERTLVNNPETGPALSARFAEQRAARLGAIKEVAGTDEYYNAIKQGVKTFAREDYDRALAEGIDRQVAATMKPQIDSLMRRPSIQSAKNIAINLARENDQSIDDFGSIHGLDYLKKALDDMISKARGPGASIGKQRLAALVQTKDDLMSVIEQLAPNYKVANDNFAQMSRQVNSMDVARALQKNLEPSLARYGANTREHAQAYAQALDSAAESVKRQVGMDLPLSRIMPTRDIATLEGVAKDLARKAKADDLGRGVGSNTAQNMAAQNALRRALGPTGLPQTWSESTALQTLMAPVTGLYRLGGAEQRIMDRLGQAALDPQDAARLLQMQAEASRLGMLAGDAQRFLPILPLTGLLAQPTQ